MRLFYSRLYQQLMNSTAVFPTGIFFLKGNCNKPCKPLAEVPPKAAAVFLRCRIGWLPWRLFLLIAVAVPILTEADFLNVMDNDTRS